MNLRGLLLYAVMIGYVALIAVPGLVVAPFDRSGRLLTSIIRQWGRLILSAVGLRVTVMGRENVPRGPAVFVSNHASALDIFLLFGHLPADFRIIHKKSLGRIPVVGAYLRYGRHIAIDRKNGFRARASLSRAAQRIRAGTSVATFPEGTRSPDGRVQPFKRGPFVLAQDAGVPVVPVTLLGVKAVVPRGLASVVPGPITMRIHPAVDTGGRLPDEVASEVRDIILRDCADGAT